MPIALPLACARSRCGGVAIPCRGNNGTKINDRQAQCGTRFYPSGNLTFSAYFSYLLWHYQQLGGKLSSLPPTLFFHFFAVREKGESHKEVKWSDTNLHIHWMCFFLKVFFGDKNGVCHILMRWYFAYSIFRKCVPIMWLLQIDRLHVYDDRDVFLFFAFFVAKLFERGEKNGSNSFWLVRLTNVYTCRVHEMLFKYNGVQGKELGR